MGQASKTRYIDEDGDASCYKVVFDGQRFVTLQGQHSPEPFDDWWSKNGEVVGNVYDNPELIGG